VNSKFAHGNAAVGHMHACMHASDTSKVSAYQPKNMVNPCRIPRHACSLMRAEKAHICSLRKQAGAHDL